MSDEPLPWATRFVANIGSKNGRRGATINACAVGMALLVLYTASIIDPRLDAAIFPYLRYVVYYAAASLFAMATLVTKQPFVTPEVRYPKCNFCGGTMRTTSLKCESCQSSSNKGE